MLVIVGTLVLALAGAGAWWYWPGGPKLKAEDASRVFTTGLGGIRNQGAAVSGATLVKNSLDSDDAQTAGLGEDHACRDNDLRSQLQSEGMGKAIAYQEFGTDATVKYSRQASETSGSLVAFGTRNDAKWFWRSACTLGDRTRDARGAAWGGTYSFRSTRDGRGGMWEVYRVAERGDQDPGLGTIECRVYYANYVASVDFFYMSDGSGSYFPAISQVDCAAFMNDLKHRVRQLS
ncbi:hypothetical protein [Acidipropionibacterium virtanenii]|uniref:Uncharacterized protein n=1 Tax=Acidipropionibacterium virtanenii TaxID=2057246 RepID=A0A344UWB2_9ACTN|nr:hypothetical protein [Acidipropionibacterium virtanenii]AXE39560.1 hypothetical protein JS278_02421 [Acidipropionibacterium virtanenii]